MREANIKKMLFITGSIFSILLIAFIITSFMYSKQKDTQLSKFDTNIIDEYNSERVSTEMETEIKDDEIREKNNKEETKKIAINTSNIEEKIQEENIEGIEKGIDNLYKHIDNIKNKFGLNVIVALNKYASDTEKEIEYIKEKLANKNIELSVVEGWAKGGDGAIDIANKLVKLSQQPNEFKYIYNDSDSIKEKILKIAKNIYYAKDVKYSEEAEKQIENIEKMGYAKLPICIAKTQYSFSDDPKNLECKDDYNINVRGVELKNGAGFVVVLAGKIMTMPGLPKVPAAESIDIDEDGEIVGIF